MARGYPDWQTSIATTLTTVIPFDQAAAGNGTVVFVLWTPAAGKRIRLLEYHVCVTASLAPGGAGTTTFRALLRDATTPNILERWVISLQVVAGGAANDTIDSGLSVVGGGGLVLPVNASLQGQIVVAGLAGSTSIVNGHIGGVEE